MIKLNIDMPDNTFECPFLEEDPDDNSLWCFFDLLVETERCTGLFSEKCKIVKGEENDKLDKRLS